MCSTERSDAIDFYIDHHSRWLVQFTDFKTDQSIHVSNYFGEVMESIKQNKKKFPQKILKHLLLYSKLFFKFLLAKVKKLGLLGKD